MILLRNNLLLLLGALAPSAFATPGIPAFVPLGCNADITAADCSNITLSALASSASGSSARVVIECGKCATFDVTDGSTLTIPGGLDIEGRLLVDPSANGVLNTTSVVVQGMLSIREPAQGNAFSINLYGTEDVEFTPHTDNAAQCGVNETTNETLPCDLGKKPIAVLGGTLDVNALPAETDKPCPSWVKLKSKSSTGPPVAEDLIPESPAVQGIKSPNERYASQTSLVTNLGGGEYVVSTAAAGYGIRMRLKPQGSLERINAVGKTLTLSWSYKVDDGGANLGWKGRVMMRWARYSRPKGVMWLDNSSCETTTASDTWAACTATFVYTSTMNNWSWNDINLVFIGSDWSSRTSTYTFHFKDIRILNLDGILETPDVLEVGTATDCWSVGDEVLVTSASSSPNGYVTRSIVNINEGTGQIFLDEAINPLNNILLSEDEGPDGSNFAVEVASLSRRVKFTAEDDDINPLHGGHLIVLNTPGVPQVLRGVEISNFGQQGNVGRYPVHIHVSEDVIGTRIEKNVIRQSNQRCVVIHGSHNATIYDNVAFDTIGHCYMLENGGEWHNTFDRNLACKNARHQVEAQWTRSDIAEPALFLISNPQNTYRNNVAAGSVAHGFWFELLKWIGGESALLDVNQGIIPRETGLLPGGFVGNVAHSCTQDGITSQGNAYEFQTRWHSSAVSEFVDIKSYKNAKDGAMINAKNIHIKGSIFADNDRCINYPLKTMAGSGNVVEDSTCTAVSQHQKDRGVVCYGQYEKSNPEPGFAGISFHVNKYDQAAEMFKNVSFTGFGDLSTCWGGQGTAIQALSPNVLDNKRWTGPASLGGNLSFDGPAFDIKCSMLDWSKIDSDHGKAFQNVYVNDNDGSTGSAVAGAPRGPGAFLATPDRDPDGSAFVDPEDCTLINYPDSCGMYCEGPCMRRIGVQNDPSRKDVAMVISDGTTTYTYDRNPNSIYYPRWKPDYEAILPKPPVGSKYTISFINTNTSKPDFPSYAKLVYGGEPPCSDHFASEDVELVMPAIDDRCSSMSINGDFQTGGSEGWHFAWFRHDVLQDGGNSTNYYLRTKDRRLKRSNVHTKVDFSCMKKGERYRISAKMRIANQVDGGFVEKSCSSSDADLDCPTINFRFTKGDDDNFPEYGIAQPESIAGDGTWANISSTFELTDDIPPDAYQAHVVFRLPNGYSSILLDDFDMEHLGTIFV